MADFFVEDVLSRSWLHPSDTSAMRRTADMATWRSIKLDALARERAGFYSCLLPCLVGSVSTTPRTN